MVRNFARPKGFRRGTARALADATMTARPTRSVLRILLVLVTLLTTFYGATLLDSLIRNWTQFQ